VGLQAIFLPAMVVVAVVIRQGSQGAASFCVWQCAEALQKTVNRYAVKPWWWCNVVDVVDVEEDVGLGCWWGSWRPNVADVSRVKVILALTNPHYHSHSHSPT